MGLSWKSVIPAPRERERLKILADMIRSKLWKGIWVKGRFLFVRRALWEDPTYIRWEEAQRQVEEHKNAEARKPAAREMRPRLLRRRKSK